MLYNNIDRKRSKIYCAKRTLEQFFMFFNFLLIFLYTCSGALVQYYLLQYDPFSTFIHVTEIAYISMEF